MLICEITGVEDENLNEANLKQMLARSALALGMAVGAGTAAAEQLFVYINPDTGKLVATKNINRIPDNAPMSFKVDTDEKTVQIIKGKEAQITPQVAAAVQSPSQSKIDTPAPINKPTASANTNNEPKISQPQQINKDTTTNNSEKNQQTIKNVKNRAVENLFDPDSAKFKQVMVMSNGMIFGLINAKNRYGGYTGWTGFSANPKDNFQNIRFHNEEHSRDIIVKSFTHYWEGGKNDRGDVFALYKDQSQ